MSSQPDWICEGFDDEKTAALVAGAARRVLKRLECSRLSVELAALSPEESRRLNRRHRRKDRTAEVLSFPLPGAEPGGEVGHVIVCPKAIRQHALKLGLSPSRWLEELTVHGVLHALGFVHDDGQMLNIQRAMLARR